MNSATLVVEGVRNIENNTVELPKARIKDLKVAQKVCLLIKSVVNGQRYSTFCSLKQNNSCGPDKIMMNKQVRENLQVRLNELVTIEVIRTPTKATKAYLQVFDTTNSDARNRSDLLVDYVLPYFEKQKFMPVHLHDHLVISNGLKPIEFKIVALEPLPYGYIDSKVITLLPMSSSISDGKSLLKYKSYEDIAGYQISIEQIRNYLEFPLKFASIFKSLNIEYGKELKVPKILLCGPKGIGKSTIAEAVAQETRAKFYKINSEQLIKEADSNLFLKRKLVEAQLSVPSIVYINNVDLIAPRKLDEEIQKQLLIQILNLLDFIEKNQLMLILIVSAENSSTINQNLLQKFRQDSGKEIELCAPNEFGRQNILRHLTRYFFMTPTTINEFKQIASETEGFVGSNLAELCEGVVKLHKKMRMVNRKKSKISIHEFKVILKNLKPNIKLVQTVKKENHSSQSDDENDTKGGYSSTCSAISPSRSPLKELSIHKKNVQTPLTHRDEPMEVDEEFPNYDI